MTIIQISEFNSYFSGKKVIVTGGTGLIGRQVVRLLHQFGATVKVLSLDQITLEQDLEIVHGDLTDFNFCKSEIQNADIVFHLAGIKASIEITKSRPASFFVPMLRFNTNVLEASRLCGISKLVYTSSIGAYSPAEIFKEELDDLNPPMDLFPGWAKRMAEMQIRAYSEEFDLNWSVVRPCNVYGPGDNFDPNNAMVIPSLMMKIYAKDNPVIVWGNGTAVRDFAYSEDVALGTIQALVNGTRGSFVNLGSGVGYSIRELVETLNQIVEFNYKFDENRSGGFPKRIMDINRAKEWIGYNPTTSLYNGLKKTWEWFKENSNEFLTKKNYFSTVTGE